MTAFDPDRAGSDAALRAYPLLRAAGAWPTVPALPPGDDPAAYAQRAGSAALAAAMDSAAAHPLVDDVIDARLHPWADTLQWAEGRVAAARAVAPLIAALPLEQVSRQIARVTGLTGIDPATLSSEVVDAISPDPPPAATALPALLDSAATASSRPVARVDQAPALAAAAFPRALAAASRPPPTTAAAMTSTLSRLDNGSAATFAGGHR